MVDTELDPDISTQVCLGWDDQCLWNAFALYNSTNMKLDFDVDFVLNGHFHNFGSTRHNTIERNTGCVCFQPWQPTFH